MSIVNRSNATLAYLVLVLVLGGASAAGHAANLLLQLLGAGLIGWTLWRGGGEKTGLRLFAVTFAVLAAVQFLPLPPALWSALPGREAIERGFALLQMPAPWLNLSLAPWNSLASLAWWIPALAVFVAARAPGAPGSIALVRTVVAVAVVGAVLGLLQQSIGLGYIYRITNLGMGTGFFANANHQGSFLLCALALLAGSWAWERRERRRRPLSADVVPGLIAALLVMGILSSGSAACIALLAPVAFAAALMAFPGLRLRSPVVLVAAVVSGAAVVAFALFGPFTADSGAAGVLPGMGRRAYLINGMRPLLDFAPFGSGLGTFVDVYRLYEDPALVGTTYVNHAHNDLLEVLIETGVLGLAAIVVFLLWFLPRAWRLWTGPRSNLMAMAASMVIGVELLHSLVDYPLRTAAMSSMVALACVLLVRPAVAARAADQRGGRRQEASHELVYI